MTETCIKISKTVFSQSSILTCNPMKLPLDVLKNHCRIRELDIGSKIDMANSIIKYERKHRWKFWPDMRNKIPKISIQSSL